MISQFTLRNYIRRAKNASFRIPKLPKRCLQARNQGKLTRTVCKLFQKAPWSANTPADHFIKCVQAQPEGLHTGYKESGASLQDELAQLTLSSWIVHLHAASNSHIDTVRKYKMSSFVLSNRIFVSQSTHKGIFMLSNYLYADIFISFARRYEKIV